MECVPTAKFDITNDFVTLAVGTNDSGVYGAGDIGTVSMVKFGTNESDVPPLFVHVTFTVTVQILCLHGVSFGVIVISVAVIIAGSSSVPIDENVGSGDAYCLMRISSTYVV